MLTISGALRAVDGFFQPESRDDALALDSPVQFDRTLVGRLVAAHEALNARFAQLLCLLDSNPVAAANATEECAVRLHELRRMEAIWLYPVIARGVDGDAAARMQLMRLRMVLLTLARRTMRQLDELMQAIRSGAQPKSAAERVSTPLAEYLRRSAFEVYPLYSLVGSNVAGTRAA